MTMFGLTPQEQTALLGGTKHLSQALQMLTYAASRKDGVTCDDCTEALGITHQTASARFHELVKAGCLTPTGKKRETRSGGAAAVHKVAKKADFRTYLSYVQSFQYRKKKHQGLTEQEQAVLTVGLEFISTWNRVKSKKGREDAAVTLINRLGNLAKKIR
jgi:hypothetical protein